jgi:hypothetical protein
MVMSTWDRCRLHNDLNHWLTFMNEVRSEGA